MAYATEADIRAMDGLSSETDYPDAVVAEAIAYATEVIHDYCGTPFESTAFSVTVPGRLSRELPLLTVEGRPILYPLTLTAVTIDGEAQDTTDWVLSPEGWVERCTGTFYGTSVTITGTHGLTAVPEAIAWACRTLAAQYLKDLHSRIPDRALQVQSDFGQITLAQAGGAPDRPTSLPEVNARLKRHRHLSPAAF